MSGHTIERKCNVASGRALEQASRWLAQHGYSVSSSSAAEVHLMDSGRRERLAVRAVGDRLVFEFAPAVPGAALRSPDVLERVVDDATQGAGGGATDSTPRRCTVCATVAKAGESSCGVCGGALA
jgi:hypothetical protein